MLLRISRLFSVSTDFLLGEDERLYLEITGLSPSQLLAHVQQIIDDIRGR